MVPMRSLMASALLAGLCGISAQAATGGVVQCRSHDYGYTECPANGLTQPQLIYQISSSACIVNRTWGFDRSRALLWVDDGCAGRFGDVGGYHHGRTGQFDPGARRYTAHGEDDGPFVGGQTLGALFEGAGSAGAGVKEGGAAAAAPAPAGKSGADESKSSANTPAAAGTAPAAVTQAPSPGHESEESDKGVQR